VTHIKHTEDNRKGDMAEFYAVTWLWDSGYEVFQNSGCTGPIDMIAMDKEGNTILIDVKTINETDGKAVYGAGRSKVQKKLGVKLLCFDSETRELRFMQHGVYGVTSHKAAHKDKNKMENSK